MGLRDLAAVLTGTGIGAQERSLVWPWPQDMMRYNGRSYLLSNQSYGPNEDARLTGERQALTSNVLLTEDSIPAGVTNQKFTGTEKTKLSDLYTRVGLDAALAGKANSSHSHTIANVTGLSAALDNKVDSTDVDTITIVTQAAYDAIVTPNARTLYLIRG